MKRLITAAQAAITNDGTPIGILIGWLMWGAAWALNSRSVETLLYGGMIVAVLWYCIMTLAFYVELGSDVSRSTRTRNLKQFIASLPTREYLVLVVTAVLLGVAFFNWDLMWVALALGACVASAIRLTYYTRHPAK